MNIQQIPVSHIRRIREIQSRVEMNGETVQEYTAAMKDGEQFPPIVVFPDGNGGYVVADGFHRLNAAKNAKLETIAAEVHDGGPRDAILYSAGANIRHGLRRSNDDKRRAVLMLLEDTEWSRWSNREIARRTGVSDPTVAKYREELSAKNSQIDMFDDTRTVTRNGTTYEMKKKHWASGLSRNEWLGSYARTHHIEHLTFEELLGRIQKGAKELTDLKMKQYEAVNAMRTIAIEEHSKRFPKGSYVRHTNGYRFGQVRSVSFNTITVLDFLIDMESDWMVDGCIPSSKEEWEAHQEEKEQRKGASQFYTLPDEEPKRIGKQQHDTFKVARRVNGQEGEDWRQRYTATLNKSGCDILIAEAMPHGHVIISAKWAKRIYEAISAKSFNPMVDDNTLILAAAGGTWTPIISELINDDVDVALYNEWETDLTEWVKAARKAATSGSDDEEPRRQTPRFNPHKEGELVVFKGTLHRIIKASGIFMDLESQAEDGTVVSGVSYQHRELEPYDDQEPDDEVSRAETNARVEVHIYRNGKRESMIQTADTSPAEFYLKLAHRLKMPVFINLYIDGPTRTGVLAFDRSADEAKAALNLLSYPSRFGNVVHIPAAEGGYVGFQMDTYATISNKTIATFMWQMWQEATAQLPQDELVEDDTYTISELWQNVIAAAERDEMYESLVDDVDVLMSWLADLRNAAVYEQAS